MSTFKCTWTEDGENKSKFFLNLEKNYCNKLITSLEVDGKIIKDKKKNSPSIKNLLRESLLRNTELTLLTRSP